MPIFAPLLLLVIYVGSKTLDLYAQKTQITPEVTLTQIETQIEHGYSFEYDVLRVERDTAT